MKGEQTLLLVDWKWLLCLNVQIKQNTSVFWEILFFSISLQCQNLKSVCAIQCNLYAKVNQWVNTCILIVIQTWCRDCWTCYCMADVPVQISCQWCIIAIEPSPLMGGIHTLQPFGRVETIWEHYLISIWMEFMCENDTCMISVLYKIPLRSDWILPNTKL